MFRSYYGVLYSNQVNFNSTPSIPCKEIFMMFPVVIYFPRQFFLADAINDKIQYLQAAGLIDYWHSEILDNRLQKRQESNEPKGIKIEYLLGCFFIWGFACIFSFLIFIWEVMKGKWRKKKEKKQITFRS